MMNENTDNRTEMNTEAVSQVSADVTAEELDGHPADLIAGMSADEIKAVIAAAKSDDAAAAAADTAFKFSWKVLFPIQKPLFPFYGFIANSPLPDNSYGVVELGFPDQQNE